MIPDGADLIRRAVNHYAVVLTNQSYCTKDSWYVLVALKCAVILDMFHWVEEGCPRENYRVEWWVCFGSIVSQLFGSSVVHVAPIHRVCPLGVAW